MRFAEFFLFCVPVVIAAIWWLGPHHFTRRAVAAAALLLIALGVSLWFLADTRKISGAYQPARIDNGRIIPGGGR